MRRGARISLFALVNSRHDLPAYVERNGAEHRSACLVFILGNFAKNLTRLSPHMAPLQRKAHHLRKLLVGNDASVACGGYETGLEVSTVDARS